MKHNNYLQAVLFSLLGLFIISFASCETAEVEHQPQSFSIEKAEMLQKHGLLQEAKLELINIIHSDINEAVIAEAYYSLGSIAFEEDRIPAALDAWRELVSNYPDSEEAIFVKDRIEELAEVIGESAEESVDNALALSYLRHGDFWSRGKSSRFTIDASWISNVDAAIKWYDKVIDEFPGSVAARIAYQDKMRTLLGWEDSGRYGQSYGIKSSFNKYMPILLETFQAFEQEFPHAATSQAFRYQIAQAYWSQRNWAKTREWLNVIIEKAGEGDSFYKDLAERRLLKVEY